MAGALATGLSVFPSRKREICSPTIPDLSILLASRSPGINRELLSGKNLVRSSALSALFPLIAQRKDEKRTLLKVEEREQEHSGKRRTKAASNWQARR